MSSLLGIAGKIVVKVALNGLLPGASSVVDFVEAAVDVSEGKYLSAAFNAGSGVLDIFTLGASGAAKDAAKESGKQAAINAAKESAKAARKEIREAAAKQIAMGATKRTVVEAAIKAAEKEIGGKFGKELAKGMLGDITEEAFKQSLAKVTLQGAGMGLIGSGGKDVVEEVFGAAASSFLNEVFSRTSREIISSSTSNAAKKAADEVAKTFFKETLARDLLFNVTKSIAKARLWFA